MATLLRTSSGKGALFIDDYGNMYSTSLSWLKGFAEGTSGRNFLILTKLDSKTNKFTSNDGKEDPNDPLSKASQKARKDDKAVGDVNEW